MKHTILIFLILICCTCCDNKNDVHKRLKMDDVTTEYDEYASNTDENSRNFIFNSDNGKKSNIIIKGTEGKSLYYTIDSTELIKTKQCLSEFLDESDSLLPLKNYFRQYIGLKIGNKKFVYINLFSHYHCRGERMPNIWENLYKENIGKYEFGHVVLDLNSYKIKEFSFITSSKKER